MIGKEERKFRVKYFFRKLTQDGEIKITPNIRVTEKFLYIEHEDGNSFVISVHDFVKENYIDLGIHTEVHYVGYTRHPHRRPVDFIHRGLSKMLYSVSNDDNDFFVYFSLFNPRVISLNNNYNIILIFQTLNWMRLKLIMKVGLLKTASYATLTLNFKMMTRKVKGQI